MITNVHGLPKPIVAALSYDGYSKGDRHVDISITRLIAPVRVVALTKRHAKEITFDVVERVWSLMGQSMHSVVEKAATEDCRAEERLYIDVLGWTVSGQIDLLEPEGTLSDFKMTSVFSFLLGDKPEWEAQLNLGAHLLRHGGHEVKKVQIIAILRDWVASKAYEHGYPQIPILVKPIPLWSSGEAQDYLEKRVRLHQEAESLSDEELPLCTPQERWDRKESFAVIKNDNKKASVVKDTQSEAETALSSLRATNPKDRYRIEHRRGESVRCKSYCQCSKWCSYYIANYLTNNH